MRSLLAFLIMLGATPAWAQGAVPESAILRCGAPDQDWHWASMQPGVESNWETGKGKAWNVRLEGGVFEAALYDDDARFHPADDTGRDTLRQNAGMLLDGHVKGNWITAVETFVGTDGYRVRLRGTLERMRPRNGAAGTDRIILHGGAITVGLMRKVGPKNVKPCNSGN